MYVENCIMGYYSNLLCSEIEFYGQQFTKDGLKPSPEKVEAVKANPPESKEAVRSFLGMTGYLSKFIPRYSSLTAHHCDRA